MSTLNPLTIDAVGPLFRWDNGMADSLASIVSLIERLEGDDSGTMPVAGQEALMEVAFEAALLLASHPVLVGGHAWSQVMGLNPDQMMSDWA